MVAAFEFDRSWEFPVPPEQFWKVISNIDELTGWWHWLEVDPDTKFVEGNQISAQVRPPLPYSLRFEIELQDVQPPNRVVAHVTGDIEGPARLEILESADGSRVRIVWSMKLQASLLKGVALFARPVLEWGHEWVVGTGLRQFREHVIANG